MTPLTLPTQVTLESKVSAGPGGAGLDVLRLLGHVRQRVRHQRAAPEPHHPVPGDGRDRPGPRLPASRAALGRAARAGGRKPAAGVPAAHPADHRDPGRRVGGPGRPARRGPGGGGGGIAARVLSQVSYMPGATGVRTNAQQAWHQGQGVCQDMAHVTVALLRVAGLPARYVSGYPHAHPAAEPGQAAVGESHAWVEYWAGPGCPAIRPAARRCGSGTWWWPGAGTTPTYRRSRASTTAPRPARLR